MTTPVNIDDQLREIAAALEPLRALEATLEAELQKAKSQRPTPMTHNDAFRIGETLRQLRQGVPMGEGIDQRLYDVLNTKELRRFKFHTPGLASLLRLRDRLLAEQRATADPPPAPELLEWRYTGEPWGKVAGARRQTGDVLRLSADVAARWADKLEPVVGGSVLELSRDSGDPADKPKHREDHQD
jgi:hypothetical protein